MKTANILLLSATLLSLIAWLSGNQWWVQNPTEPQAITLTLLHVLGLAFPIIYLTGSV